MRFGARLGSRLGASSLALALVGGLATGKHPQSPPPGRQTVAAIAAVAPNTLTGEQALARLLAERDAYWQSARRIVHKSVLELVAQDPAERERGLRYTKILKGKAGKKQIALTFDDGPHPAYTPQLLAILRRYHVKATFFLVGAQAERYPDLVRAEARDGHTIANHTYHHVSLPKVPQEYVMDEIKTCGLVLQAITGQAPRLFRPPGGEYTPEVAEASEALGYTLVLWTDDPGDYAHPGAPVILSRTLQKAGDGGIILLHDGIGETLQALPQILETLRRQGYEFVTVDQMLAARRYRKIAPEPALRVPSPV